MTVKNRSELRATDLRFGNAHSAATNSLSLLFTAVCIAIRAAPTPFATLVLFFQNNVSGKNYLRTWYQEICRWTKTPLIQQYLQLRSEFMGYLYAMTRDADLAEEVYQNAAVVVMEKAGGPEPIRELPCLGKGGGASSGASRNSYKSGFRKARSINPQ